MKSERDLWIHALLLGSMPFREKDRIVRLLCLEHGKISAVAHSAAVSKKRFPPALLEGFNLLKVELRPPRGGEDGEGGLWTLNGAELRQSYDHFRVGYREIEMGIFPQKLIIDLVPDGPSDPSLFKALGRYLRDSSQLDLASVSWWLPLSFWTWFAHFQGFGDLTGELEKSSPESLRPFWQAWHQSLARSEVDFSGLFQQLKRFELPKLSAAVLRDIYGRWLEISGIHWKHFEEMIK